MDRENVLSRQRGQSLVELCLCLPLVVVLGWSLIEVCRLVVFRSVLQVGANEIAAQVSERELAIRRNHLVRESGSSASDVSESLSRQMNMRLEQFLASIPIFRWTFQGNKLLEDQFFRIYVQINKPSLAPGVYVQVNSCLPLLFGSRSASSDVNVSDSSDLERDCLGQYVSSRFPVGISLRQGGIVVRVRVLGFAAWHAGSQIFAHGLGEPGRYNGVEPVHADMAGSEIAGDKSRHRVDEFLKNPSFVGQLMNE